MSFYAFKGFEYDLSCRGFQYEIGKTYGFNGPPIKCQQGFHYCTLLRDVFVYYQRYAYITNIYDQHPAWYYHYIKAHSYNKPVEPVERIFSSNRYCVVEVLGDVDGQTSILSNTKGATNKIRIVKELTQNEIEEILNNYPVEFVSENPVSSYLLEFKEEVSDGKR